MPKVSFSSSENNMHAIRNYICNVDHMKIADFLMMSHLRYANYQMAPHFWLYYICIRRQGAVASFFFLLLRQYDDIINETE